MALFLLAAVLLATACSNPQQQESREQGYKGTVTLWAAADLAGYTGPSQPQGGWSAWFSERAKAYEAAHPGAKVEITLFESATELERKVTAPGNTEPDLLFGRYLPELAGRLASVSLSGEQRADYWPGALNAFQNKAGELNGLPLLSEVQILALNENAFAAAGATLPAQSRWTQDEFDITLKKLAGNGRYGLGFYSLPGYHEWYPLADGVLTSSGGVAEGLETGLSRIARYRRDGLLYPDTGKVKADEIWGRFAAAKPAFGILPTGAWAIPILRSEPYNAKLTVAGFPGDVTVGYVYGFTMFRSEDEGRQKAAAELAQFLSAPDQQVRLARQLLLMPARKSAGNPFEGDPQLTQAYGLAGSLRPLPAGPVWDQRERPLAQELLYAVLGARSPAAALEQIRTLTLATPPAAK